MTTLSFPRSDNALLAWSLNFRDLITATPTSFNLVTADATAYALVHTAFATALAACDPSQRNKSAVVAKNAARTSLKNAATLLANKVYAGASVTDAQKVELGIPPRAQPQKRPAPASAPVFEIISVNAWTVRARLRAAGGDSRGKLPGTAGASIFSYVGTSAPTDLGSWKFEGSTGKVTKIDIAFPNTLASGTKVWLTAFWFNGSKASGPMCDPVGVTLQGGSVSMTA